MLFAFLPQFGYMEMIVVSGVVLLLFGNRLPSVMRSLGKSVVEFKKGISGAEEGTDATVVEKKVPASPVD